MSALSTCLDNRVIKSNIMNIQYSPQYMTLQACCIPNCTARHRMSLPFPLRHHIGSPLETALDLHTLFEGYFHSSWHVYASNNHQKGNQNHSHKQSYNFLWHRSQKTRTWEIYLGQARHQKMMMMSTSLWRLPWWLKWL